MGDTDDLRGHDDSIATFIGVFHADKLSAGMDQHRDLQKQALSLPHSVVFPHCIEDLEHIFLYGLRVAA